MIVLEVKEYQVKQQGNDMEYRTYIKYNNGETLVDIHECFEAAENHLLSETELKSMIKGEVVDQDGERIADYMGEHTTQKQYENR